MEGGGDAGGKPEGTGATGGGAVALPNNRVYSPGPAGGGAGCGGGDEKPDHAEPNVGSVGGGDGDLGISNGVGAGATGSAKTLGG